MSRCRLLRILLITLAGICHANISFAGQFLIKSTDDLFQWGILRNSGGNYVFTILGTQMAVNYHQTGVFSVTTQYGDLLQVDYGSQAFMQLSALVMEHPVQQDHGLPSGGYYLTYSPHSCQWSTQGYHYAPYAAAQMHHEPGAAYLMPDGFPGGVNMGIPPGSQMPVFFQHSPSPGVLVPTGSIAYPVTPAGQSGNMPVTSAITSAPENQQNQPDPVTAATPSEVTSPAAVESDLSTSVSLLPADEIASILPPAPGLADNVPAGLQAESRTQKLDIVIMDTPAPELNTSETNGLPVADNPITPALGQPEEDGMASGSAGDALAESGLYETVGQAGINNAQNDITEELLEELLIVAPDTENRISLPLSAVGSPVPAEEPVTSSTDVLSSEVSAVADPLSPETAGSYRIQGSRIRNSQKNTASLQAMLTTL